MAKIGFIGQGWIGKNYSDDLEERGFDVTRYSLDPPFNTNRDAIKNCDIVFVAVPTPTTIDGFDDSIVESCLHLVGTGKIVVIKSTLLPGTTEKLQKLFPDLFVFHSPEFLVEATARYDAGHPARNIIGIPIENEEYRAKAKAVLMVLPEAPCNMIINSSSAELIKYAGNCMLYMKVVFVNQLFDVSQKLNLDWNEIKYAIAGDPRLGSTHLDPIHKTGRGAGGHCFIKDFRAFIEMYSNIIPEDYDGLVMLDAIERKNISLLMNSKKDLDLLKDCDII